MLLATHPTGARYVRNAMPGVGGVKQPRTDIDMLYSSLQSPMMANKDALSGRAD